MNRYRAQPNWEFLLSASRSTLQSYELTRLSHAANLRKEIGNLMDQWLEDYSDAAVARLLLIHPMHASESAQTPDKTSAESGSDNFFPDSTLGPPESRDAA